MAGGFCILWGRATGFEADPSTPPSFTTRFTFTLLRFNMLSFLSVSIRRLRKPAIVLAVGLWAFPARTAPAPAENIPPRQYYDTVQRELSKAKKSITVCMYLFTFRPHQTQSPVFKLAQSLERAHRAGIRVEVLLDQNINFTDGDHRASDLSEGKNAPAYAFLKAQGIPVFYDDASTYTHAKAVVIDEETVITGSTNWTDSALTRNQEVNILVRSKDLARDILAGLRAIPRSDPLPNYDDDAVEIPGEFLQNPNLFARMVRTKDDRDFDLYLYLLKIQKDNPETQTHTLSHQTLAAALGLSNADPSASRRRVRRHLASLQKDYGLIQVRSEFNQDAQITLTDLPSDRSARLPARYWSLGWDRRLSFAEKAFLVIGQFESAVSTRRPRWSAARTTLSRRYGASPWFLTQGTTGLRRRNLLEVDYSALPAGPTPRLPSVYTPNPLYDPRDLDKKLAELKAKHGEAKFNRAQTAAAVVYEDADVNGIKELLELETQLGPERVQSAVALLSQKAPDNPTRTLAYLLGTIRNLPE